MQAARKPPSGTDPSQDTEPFDPQRLVTALDRHRAQFAMVKRCVAITIDVRDAALRVLEMSRGWGPYAARIATLPATEVDHAQLANIESIALATLQADAEYRSVTAPPDDLFECLREGARLRAILYAEASILVRHGLMPLGILNQIDHGPGYRNVALGLSATVNALKKHWSGFQGQTALTANDLRAANLLSDKMFRNGSLRRVKHPSQSAAAQLRAQAFTTLVRAYDEMRFCLEYLEGDRAEVLAPSLYRGQTRRRAKRNAQQTLPAPAAASAAASAAAEPSVSPQPPGRSAF